MSGSSTEDAQLRVRPRGVAAALFGEVGREALVEALDRHVDDFAQGVDETLRLGRLLPVLAAQGQRKADDDALGARARRPAPQTREPSSLPARSTTPTGRATVPVGSETATPVRAEP